MIGISSKQFCNISQAKSIANPVCKMAFFKGTTFSVLLIANCTIIGVLSIKCKVHDVYPVDEISSASRSCFSRVDGNEYTRDGFNHNDDDRNNPYRIRNRGPLQMKFERNRRSSTDRSNNPTSDGHYPNRRGQVQQNDKSCMLQCVFEQLNMVDKNGFPDKHKVMYVLSQNIREQELIEFQKDGIEECFHYLQVEKMKMDKCQYTVAFSSCLKNYHALNCEDWDYNRIGLRYL